MKKQYYNKVTNEWIAEGQSVTRRVTNGVFSGIPSIEQLTEWGFEEYIAPETEVVEPKEPTPTELLERAKANKINEIEMYDSSDAVNSFRVNIGNEVIDTWITPEQRSDYKNSIDAAELLGMTEVHPVLNGVAITLDIQTAKMALAKIQIYANQCYGVTEQHKLAVNKLNSIEEVEAYDFTAGYPEKLIFNVD